MRDILALSALLGLASAGTVSVDIHKKVNPEFYEALKITRRDDIVDLQALNNITGGGYYAEFGIGTPPQILTFHLDTGSSDTWVNLKGNDFCRYGRPLQGLPPNCYKQFDPSQSSTYKVAIRGGFEIGYLDGSTASGDYFNDTVTIGTNITIQQQQLGLARESGTATGLMGLGLNVGVAAKKKYPTIVDNLVAQGRISTAAFSLYLDSITESHGSFLFGGIDTKKYIDNLVTLPLEPDTLSKSVNVTSYAVSLQGFTVDGISTPDLQTKAILDTGATLVLLPGRVVQPIFDKLGVIFLPSIPTPFIDCGAASKKKATRTKFSFKFDGKTIAVPIKEMIINSFADHQDLFKSAELKPYFKGFDTVCMFGIGNADKYQTEGGGYSSSSSSGSGSSQPEYALLGDTFLRSAYVVYDLAAQQVSIAQAYPRSNESSIVQLKANSSIPSIKGMDAPPEDTSSAGTVRASSAVVVGAAAFFIAAAAAL